MGTITSTTRLAKNRSQHACSGDGMRCLHCRQADDSLSGRLGVMWTQPRDQLDPAFMSSLVTSG